MGMAGAGEGEIGVTIDLCEECDEVCDDGRARVSPYSGSRLCALCLQEEESEARGNGDTESTEDRNG